MKLQLLTYPRGESLPKIMIAKIGIDFVAVGYILTDSHPNGRVKLWGFS